MKAQIRVFFSSLNFQRQVFKGSVSQNTDKKFVFLINKEI